MNPNICNNCGGDYEYRHGRWICRSCGAYKPEEISNEEVTLLYTASQKLRLAEFDEAELEFDDIVRKYPQNPNGYWGRLLCRYGIKYEEDFDGRMIPTCYATSIESVLSDADYKKALEFADKETREYYTGQAEYMERVRKEWVEKARKEKPYDIFICYKDSDLANGIERTQDSIAAQDLYIHLTNKGYRVFYSHESLRDKVGEKYEPYIFNALSTAKVMLVYGSKPEYITSTWLKNEWTRYEKRIKAGEKKPNSLLVACDGFSPAQLPKALASRQCFDATQRSFYGDLDAVVDKLLRPKKEPAKPAEVPAKKKSKAPIVTAILTVAILAVAGFAAWSFLGQSGDQGTLTNEQYHATVIAHDKEFPEGTVFSVEEVPQHTQSEALKDIIASLPINVDHAHVYDMNLMNNGMVLTVDGNITVTIDLPDDIQADRAVVYYLTETSSRKVSSEVSNGKITFVTNHFSYYMIAEMVDETQKDTVCLHDEVIDEAVLSTCTETGLTEGKHCSICSEVLIAQETVDALGHTPGAEAACTVAQICTICNAELVAALGHTETIDEAIAPTCTETGLTEGKHCSVCSEPLIAQETVDALGHTEVTDEAIAPTCTENGATEGSHCSTCNEVFVAQEPIEALGHTPGPEATCTDPQKCVVCKVNMIAALGHTPGHEATCTTAQTCLVCEAEIVAALGHTEVMDRAVDPTCTEPGLTEGKHCSACSTVLVAQETVNALGHTPGAEATCTTNQSCTVCETELVAALGHNEVTDAAVAPTCTATGLTEGKHCSVCSAVLIPQETVAALGHAEVTDAAVAPTCTETGLTEGSHCAICNEIFVAQQTVAALGHTPGAEATCTNPQTCTVCGEELVPATGHTEVIDAAVLPTCTTSGKTEGKHCSVCHEILIAQQTVAARHTEVTDAAVSPTCTATGLTAGKHCSVCNEVLVAQTTVAALGHTEVTAAAIAPTCTATGLTEGKHCSTCGEIFAAQNIVAALGHTPGAEATCTAAQLCTICRATLQPALSHNYSATVTEPTVTDHGYATYTCVDCGGSYTETIIPSEFTVTSHNRNQIGYTGEAGEFLIIPAVFEENGVWYRITTIDEWAFSNCSNLSGVIIPDSVTIIGRSAFEGCTGLMHVTVSAGVVSVNGYVFNNCSSLTSVTLPAGVMYVGYYAFSGCTRLTNVYYAGSVDEWNDISIAWYNTPLTTATVHYHYQSNHTHTPGVAATCTTPQTCAECDIVLAKALGHTEVTDAAVAPTCTATGLTAGTHCSVCNEVLVAQTEVAALGHTEVADAAVAPTCTATGLTAGTHCSVCNEVLVVQTEVAALGHTEVADAAVAPTCTATGLTAGKHCSVCGEVFVAQATLPASGHTEVVDAAEAPTCTTTGLTAGKHCSVCDTVLAAQQTVAALGHTEVIDVATAPTCTSTGVTAGKHCSVCNEVLEAQETVAALGHTPSTEATCTTAQICTVCNAELVAALGHTEVIDAAVAPTCTVNGLTEGKHCFVCREILIPQIAVEARHHYVSDITAPTETEDGYAIYTCSDCDDCVEETITPISFTVTAQNRSKIGYTGAQEENLVIPAVFQDVDGIWYRVIAIGNAAFYNCTNLTSIIIPDSVVSIASGSFQNCSNLTHITLPFVGDGVSNTNFGYIFGNNNWGFNDLFVPTSLKTITVTKGLTGRFNGCVSLTEVILPDGVTEIESSAFNGCASLLSIRIPESVVCIGDYAFEGCVGLTEVVIPENVTSIGHSAFKRCTQITEIIIPASVTRIDHQAFYHCTALTQVTIGENVESIGQRAFEGCIGLTELVIPNRVTNIDAWPFMNCSGLVNVVIGQGVTNIPQNAFQDCTNLKKIVIPKEVQSISDSAFMGCTNLTDICYLGTESEWKSIRKATTWNNNTGSYTIHYEYDPTHEHDDVIDAAVDPTCTATGLTEGKHCSVCHKVLLAQTTIAALGHTEVIDEATAPTCTTTGLTEGKHCSTCNEVLMARTTVAALGHTEAIDAAVVPTCTTTGLTEGKHCSACDEVLVAQQTVAALGHTEVNDVAVAPTCITTGLTEGKHCSVCNEVLMAQEVVNATGHLYDSSVSFSTASDTGHAEYTCSGCGDFYAETIIPVNFTITANNLTLIGYIGERDENWLIPAFFKSNGTWYRVSAIDREAFRDCANLASITIPVSVTSIGESAFNGCSGLTSLTFEGSTTQWTEIGKNTGWDNGLFVSFVVCWDDIICFSHTEVTDAAVAPTCTATGLTEGKHCSVCNTVLMAQQEVVATGHSNTSEVTPPTATENGYILYTCTICGETSREAIVPESYTFTGADVQQYHDGDSVLMIPAVFQGEDGTWYRVTDISTFLYDETNLIISKMYIPSSVLVIPMPIYDLGRRKDETFRVIVDEDHPNYSVHDTVLYNKNQTELVFCPATVRSYVIPSSVIRIGDYAFNHCSGLGSITFEGTVEQWNAITKGTDWHNNVPATVVHCSDDDVPIR